MYCEKCDGYSCQAYNTDELYAKGSVTYGLRTRNIEDCHGWDMYFDQLKSNFKGSITTDYKTKIHAHPIWISLMCKELAQTNVELTLKNRWIWPNFGPGNGLLPAGTKPLRVPMLTYHQFRGIHSHDGNFNTRHINHYTSRINTVYLRVERVNITNTDWDLSLFP